MAFLQNLHTHSTFCDGRDTLQEMAQAAWEQGFDSIGFSGHASTPFDLSYCMQPDKLAQYRIEIAALRAAYAGRMEVYCGIEFDLFSDVDLAPYDYIIGSAHYLKCGEERVDFDRDAVWVRELIDTRFGGDGLAYAKTYYETVSGLCECDHIDIVGHFDLISKNCERDPGLFDPESKPYRAAALEALHAVAARHPVFEINTGAIARGYRTAPYPADFLLRELHALGGSIVLTADCHDRRALKTHRSLACEFAKHCGFTEQLVLRAGGFEALPLE